MGRPTLYLMPTHDEIRERLDKIAGDGKTANWTHYEGHKPGCVVRRWADKGYSGPPCDCDRHNAAFDPETPTLAALDVVLTDHTTRYSAHDDAPLFPLWIIDEIDFGRFVTDKHASRADIGMVLASAAAAPGSPGCAVSGTEDSGSAADSASH